MAKKKPNPFCPVRGCKTKTPHTNDPVVQGLIAWTAQPQLIAGLAFAGMTALRESISRDVMENRMFSWLTRIRQVEELYIRALYLLLVADESVIPHFLSEEHPNGLAQLYQQVNESIFFGKGELQLKQPGLASGEFAPLDIMHQATHVSFRALMMAKGLHDDPSLVDANLFLHKIETNCDHLMQMTHMFAIGQGKAAVLASIQSRYKQAKVWVE